MKSYTWWSPETSLAPDASSLPLLSRFWVQAFAFELPALRKDELEATLRYKVRATLPVDIDTFTLHTQIFQRARKRIGAAFLVSNEVMELLPNSGRQLKVAIPIFLPPSLGSEVLLIIASPQGLEAHFYAGGLLSSSYAPIRQGDASLLGRVLQLHPEATVVGIAPHPAFPLPEELAEKEPSAALRQAILGSFPLLAPRPPSKLPLVAAWLLLAAGLVLCGLSAGRGFEARVQRNAAWLAWVRQTEKLAASPGLQTQAATLLKAQGLPVPDLFVHIARSWGKDTRIQSLEWNQGKLILKASSTSALDSIRKLMSDPWFHALRVDEILSQKDGSEVFTLEGGLSIDH